MQRLTIFISSTIKDFGPVRADIRRWLTEQGADVRASEDDRFPVDDGVTSHDACLRAVEGCNLVVVLIGKRYGGKYAGTPKSITRREYEEARRLHIPVIVLVLAEVTSLAEQWHKKLLATPPFGTDTDALIDFLNIVRKDRLDNWIHPTWTGSFFDAQRIIQSRINALFVRYQRPHVEVVARAERLGAYASARAAIDRLPLVLRGAPMEAQEKVHLLLMAVAENREPLLGFREGELWNVALYVPKGSGTRQRLRVFARVADERIRRQDRAWRPGQGHVGTAWKEQRRLAAADLTVTDSWAGAHKGDEHVYRSAIAEVVSDATARPCGVLVVTSNRLDHFRDLDQPEVSTVASIGSLVSLLMQEQPHAATKA